MRDLGALLWIPYGLMCLTLAANLWYLARQRRRPAPRADLKVSVLIPARDEERNLRRLLPSVLRQRDVELEVIIYDDDSTDQTAAVAAGTGDARVRAIRGHGPPAGWVGKVHALYQASRLATGDVLLFLDADTVLKHEGVLAALLARFAALPAHSALTAVPHFKGGGSLLVSAVPYLMLVNLPLPLVPILRSRYVAALNGQCWMIGREDYRAHEPHLRHQGEVLEDIQIGRYLSARGVVPRFEDVRAEVEVWMYDGLRDAWRGFRKNAFLVAGGSVAGFAAYFGLYVAVFLLAPVVSVWFPILAVTTKLVSDRHARYPIWVSLLAPVTFAMWAALLVDSALSHRLGTVRWKGRDVTQR
jgi:glycosyltransferase involved in cell wall biosynthesis